MSDDETFREDYHRYIGRKILFIVILLVIILITTVYSCTISGRPMTFTQGWDAIVNCITGKEFPYNSDPYWDMYVVSNITLPRVLGGVACGAGLAICGAVMQSLFNNPLAEPYTTGVSSGAVFGACLALVLGFSITGAAQFGVFFNAFLFAMLPMGVILFLGKVLKILSPVTMILAGTALSFFFGGLTTIMLVTTDEDTLANAYRWQVGSLDNLFWDNVWLVLIVVLIGSLLILLMSKYLNAMSMGVKTAKSLGIDVQNVRLICIVLCAIIAAVIISFTGVIGFVGLVAPHIVRIFIGGDNSFVLPASMVTGAAVLVLSDTFSRWMIDVDMPVGVVMMLFGAPLFIWLMIRKKSRGVIY